MPLQLLLRAGETEVRCADHERRTVTVGEANPEQPAVAVDLIHPDADVACSVFHLGE